jgi:hypothetical protein
VSGQVFESVEISADLAISFPFLSIAAAWK